MEALTTPTAIDFDKAIVHWIELAALAIEILAVAIIVFAVLGGTALYLYRTLRGWEPGRCYTSYKNGLARSMLLGLEILVAADVVRTVALEPSLNSVGVLGLLVVIRTFLSWSLVVEAEGHWPWQRREEPRNPPDALDGSSLPVSQPCDPGKTS